MPGVLLIAALSGAGAVNSAWNAYEWRERFKGRPITEATILTTEMALRKAQEDMQARQRELDNIGEASVGAFNALRKMGWSHGRDQKTGPPSFLSRLLANDPKQKGRLLDIQARSIVF